MINVLKPRILVNYSLFWVLLGLISTNQNYQKYTLSTSIGNDELKELYFDDTSDAKICHEWIPSLFNPILLVGYNVELNPLINYDEDKISFPIFSIPEPIQVAYYNFSFLDQYILNLAKITFNKIVTKCYFGLSIGVANYNKLDESQINLNILKDNNIIHETIFSFDKWSINDNSIKTNLYLGDEHEIFSKDGIIGTCKADKDLYWGCSFKKMVFNNKTIDLIKDKDNDIYYKIYFSSENYLIRFPESFKTKFNKETDDICIEKENTKYLDCNNLFDSKEYIQMKLIDDNMTITIEVDNLNRFNKYKDEQKHTTRILFENDYFIFPLIMFKNFHVQFDSNKNIISFYTDDPNILEVKKKEDNSPSEDNNNNDSSNAGTIILIIIIILIILILGFGVFWFLRKRKSSSEKNINKYNKFEEDDNFQDMNEKRVF